MRRTGRTIRNKSQREPKNRLKVRALPGKAGDGPTADDSNLRDVKRLVDYAHPDHSGKTPFCTMPPPRLVPAPNPPLAAPAAPPGPASAVAGFDDGRKLATSASPESWSRPAEPPSTRSLGWLQSYRVSHDSG